MWKRQKKLIDILEKEGLMDKELKFGQLLKIKTEYNVNDWLTLEIWDIVKYTWFQNKHGTFVKIDKIADPVQISIDYDIIWQYHLWSILQLLNRWSRHTIAIERVWCIVEMQRIKGQYTYLFRNNKNVKVDITKPPMEWEEEQNKELVLFIEWLWNDN